MAQKTSNWKIEIKAKLLKFVTMQKMHENKKKGKNIKKNKISSKALLWSLQNIEKFVTKNHQLAQNK